MYLGRYLSVYEIQLGTQVTTYHLSHGSRYYGIFWQVGWYGVIGLILSLFLCSFTVRDLSV